MTNPKLLVLDKATEGFVPVIRDEIWHMLGQIKREVRLLHLADRHVVIEKGRGVWQGDADQLCSQPGIVHQFLSV